ncbi:MAG: hypothetical protein WEC84_04145 [Candidatus Andersenbacteria bacterium]
MRTVFGLFNTPAEANGFLGEIQTEGFSQDDISIIGQKDVLVDERKHSHTAEDAGKGAGIGGILGLIAGIAPVVLPGIGLIIGTGTLIAGTLGGAGLGSIVGGIVGFFRDQLGMDEDRAHVYEQGIQEGNILLTVHTNTADAAEAVEEAMVRYGAHDIHIHERELARA